jgi:hypothetical protein
MLYMDVFLSSRTMQMTWRFGEMPEFTLLFGQMALFFWNGGSMYLRKVTKPPLRQDISVLWVIDDCEEHHRRQDACHCGRRITTAITMPIRIFLLKLRQVIHCFLLKILRQVGSRFLLYGLVIWSPSMMIEFMMSTRVCRCIPFPFPWQLVTLAIYKYY